MPTSINGSTGGGGASAPAGTGVVTVSSGAFVDPVPSAATTRATLDALQDVFTTRGDIVRAGVSGVAERLALGTNGQVLTSDGTDAAWAAPSGGAPSGAAGGDLGGTYPNPTVTDLTIASEARGDLLRRGASAWQRVAVGTNGQVLTSDGTDPVWATPSGGGSTVYTPDLTAAGAVLTNGSGTASASGTAVTLSLDGATTATWYGGTYNGPRITITPQSGWSPSISPHRFDARARISSRTGGGGASLGNTVAILCLDGGAAARYGIYGKNTTVGSENQSSSGAAGVASTTGAGLAWDGNDWLRVRIDGAQINFYFGRGVGGAAPASTAWVSIGATTWTVTANGSGFALSIVLTQGPTAAGGTGPVLVVDNVTLTGLT